MELKLANLKFKQENIEFIKNFSFVSLQGLVGGLVGGLVTA